jgi:hypothetical protein
MTAVTRLAGLRKRSIGPVSFEVAVALLIL